MYEWLKVVHILAVISWMAGLLYLPRLMVYHVGVDVGSAQDETFKIMERRLLNAIMRPAAVVSLVTGLVLAHVIGAWLSDVWFTVKLIALLTLFGSHGVMEKHVAMFRRGARTKSHVYYRVLNEVPTVLMIVIVIMVIVKPFS
jgi:protoporphyrinogen IX oxidase